MKKSLYDRYKNLLGLSYIEGNQDCYGLLRRYYKQNYGLELTNYARPGDFAHSGMDIVMEFFSGEGFEIVEVNLNQLLLGDGLLFRINGAPLVNHVGAYVGNNMILHHLYKGLSKEDDFNDRWKARVMTVVRHPEVTAINSKEMEVFDLMDSFLPNDPAKD